MNIGFWLHRRAQTPGGDPAAQLGAAVGLLLHFSPYSFNTETPDYTNLVNAIVANGQVLAELPGKGIFMDLMRYRSGEAAENGEILAERKMSGGIETTAQGSREGDTWTVVMSRPLKSDKPGDISFEPGKIYAMSIALHDDFTSARFPHVSLEMKCGIEAAEADIVPVKR